MPEMHPAGNPHPALAWLLVLSSAVVLVLVIGARTNSLGPKWDTEYYVDMAANGLAGNHKLAAPFAYRPAVPMLVSGVARILNTEPEATFRVCAWIMCIAFVCASFGFARFFQASFGSAWLASILAALYYFIVKWTLFSGTMVDIYTYPLVLLAFGAMLRGRFYLCLAECAVGLFFKEFLLLPLLTQSAVLVLRERRHARALIKPLGLTGLVLLVCFVLPRVLIHVGATFQDIDPINNPRSLRLLIAYPASIKRDYNILFYYLACWLPVLLLLSKRRASLVWLDLEPYRITLCIYLTFHFLLVMYGGTNLDIFVTYSLPVELIVLTIILDRGGVRSSEKILTTAVVIVFNRLWAYVPLPDQDMKAYLNFYGGYHTEVTRRSFARLAEMLLYLLVVWGIRGKLVRPGEQLSS